jgi:hypothetical protein
VILGRFTVPYMSCPSCRLTHYEAATAIVTTRTCPRCRRKLGIESTLFESPTLTDARAALATLPPGVEGIVAAGSSGGPAAAAG